jgi:hypothetical protein
MEDKMTVTTPKMSWKPIDTAPDGKNILTITRHFDGFYEPEILYRNGEWWFIGAGERSFSKPTYWMELPDAPRL